MKEAEEAIMNHLQIEQGSEFSKNLDKLGEDATLKQKAVVGVATAESMDIEIDTLEIRGQLPGSPLMKITYHVNEEPNPVTEYYWTPYERIRGWDYFHFRSTTKSKFDSAIWK